MFWAHDIRPPARPMTHSHKQSPNNPRLRHVLSLKVELAVKVRFNPAGYVEQFGDNWQDARRCFVAIEVASFYGVHL